MRDSAFGAPAVITRHAPKKKDKEVNVGGIATGAASGAFTGAEMGSTLGPWGTGAGAVIGGIIGGYAGSGSPGSVSDVAGAKEGYDKAALRSAAALAKAKAAKLAAKGSKDGFLKAGQFIAKAAAK
tara:strand:- start:10115 stop:10492 length:378 start_codon:yes stop_codon:yes gene_type:complete